MVSFQILCRKDEEEGYRPLLNALQHLKIVGSKFIVKELNQTFDCIKKNAEKSAEKGDKTKGL